MFFGLFLFKIVFYACFMLVGIWKSRKKLRVGIFLSKNLLARVTGNKQLLKA